MVTVALPATEAMALPETETMARPLPPPNFTAAFTAPHLRWPSTKRLRCSNTAVPASCSPLRFSPSRSPLHQGAAASVPPPRPGSPLTPQSPTLSDPPKFFIRLRTPISRDEAGEPPAGTSPSRTNPTYPVPTDAAGGLGGEAVAGRTLRSSSRRAGEEIGRKTKRRVELWVPLSRGEIEEDFLRMTGSKPPRKCRLRRRSAAPDVLSGIFPGSWLPNRITADRYKVSEHLNQGEGCHDC